MLKRWKVSACCLVTGTLIASNVFCAPFTFNSDSLEFPDGSSIKTAPRDGKSVLNGSGAPAIIGNVGDFYIDTTNFKLYGPYNGTWGTGFSLTGPQGPTGSQGPIGPTGPKGETGASAQITLASMCTAITAGGAPLPSFCPNYTTTYSLSDLKGTWKSHKLQSINDSNGNLSNMAWFRSTITINQSGSATITSTANSNGDPLNTSTGTFYISSDGTVTASSPAAQNLSGNMSMDKNTIVITSNSCSTNTCRAITVLVKVAP